MGNVQGWHAGHVKFPLKKSSVVQGQLGDHPGINRSFRVHHLSVIVGIEKGWCNQGHGNKTFELFRFNGFLQGVIQAHNHIGGQTFGCKKTKVSTQSEVNALFPQGGYGAQSSRPGGTKLRDGPQLAGLHLGVDHARRTNHHIHKAT